MRVDPKDAESSVIDDSVDEAEVVNGTSNGQGICILS